MRKIIFVSIFCLISLCSHAQEQKEHLKFMGIPLNGKISVFHNQLLKKGARYNETFSKYSQSNGVRLYNASFAGEEAEIFVYHNKKTKIVYRAKAVIEQRSEDLIELKYKNIKELLIKKYDPKARFEKYSGIDVPDTAFQNVKWFIEDNNRGKESTNFMIYSFEESHSIGEIDLYISQNDRDPDLFYLHIDYIDFANDDADKDKRMDDL
jgi:hypothetical protein